LRRFPELPGQTQSDGPETKQRVLRRPGEDCELSAETLSIISRELVPLDVCMQFANQCFRAPNSLETE